MLEDPFRGQVVEPEEDLDEGEGEDDARALAGGQAGFHFRTTAASSRASERILSRRSKDTCVAASHFASGGFGWASRKIASEPTATPARTR